MRPCRGSVASAMLALLLVPAALPAAPAAEEPALARIAGDIVARLAGRFPARSGVVLSVDGPRASVSLQGAAVGELLDLYAPERASTPDGAPLPDAPEAGATSFYVLGRVRVVDLSAAGAVVEPVPPLSIAHLAAGQTVKPRRGPRRVGLVVSADRRELEGVASALRTILPAALRPSGLLAVDAGLVPQGTLLDLPLETERRMQERSLDNVLHVVLALSGGELRAFVELATAPEGAAGEGAGAAWTVFSTGAPLDAQIALLLGVRGSDGPGLRVLASVPLPGPPMAMATGLGEVAVLAGDALLCFRLEEGGLRADGRIDLPADLPRAPRHVRSRSAFLSVADRDRDGRTEVYLLANWLELPYRAVLPATHLQPMTEAVLATSASGSYVSGAFEEGTDRLAPALVYRADGRAPVRTEMPSAVLRIVPLEGEHFLVLTESYEIAILKPEHGEVAALSPAGRSGYAFGVAYDAGSARTVLALSGRGAGRDGITLEPLHPPRTGLARVELSGVAEGVVLEDLDGDGRLDLLVAEGPTRDGDGASRLSLFATGLLAESPSAELP